MKPSSDGSGKENLLEEQASLRFRSRGERLQQQFELVVREPEFVVEEAQTLAASKQLTTALRHQRLQTSTTSGDSARIQHILRQIRAACSE